MDNLQRSDLSPSETALAMARLVELGISQKELARRSVKVVCYRRTPTGRPPTPRQVAGSERAASGEKPLQPGLPAASHVLRAGRRVALPEQPLSWSQLPDLTGPTRR